MRFAHTQNIVPKGPPKPTVRNAEHTPAFAESLRQSIARVAFTGVLGDQFYGKEEQQANELSKLCQDAAAVHPRFLLNAARVSRAANFKLFPKLAIGALISTCDDAAWRSIEPAALDLLSGYSAGQLLELAIVLKARQFGRGLGSRAQRVLGQALGNRDGKRFEDMTLSDREDVRRLLRLLHPKRRVFSDQQIRALGYCLGDKADPKTVRQTAMQRLTESLDQSVLISAHQLPFNATKGVANSHQQTWEAIRDNMSPLQVLINLKALTERGVMSPEWLRQFLDNVDVGRTRLVPHDVLRPLGMCLEGRYGREYYDILLRFLARLSSKPLSGLEGKRLGALLDFSGSMAPGYGQNSLGNWVLAVVMAAPLLASDPGRKLAFFGTEAYWEGQRTALRNHPVTVFPDLRGRSTYDAFMALLGLRPDQSTDVAKGIELYIRGHVVVDALFLFTDEQENGARSGLSAWRRYREQVNPNARLIVVNVSNTKWHLARYDDPTVTVIQTITPLIYEQFSRFDQSAVDMIANWDDRHRV